MTHVGSQSVHKALCLANVYEEDTESESEQGVEERPLVGFQQTRNMIRYAVQTDHSGISFCLKRAGKIKGMTRVW